MLNHNSYDKIKSVYVLFDNVFKTCIFLFFLLTFTRIHGFSLTVWPNIIEGKNSLDQIFGSPRDLRTDDWSIEIPIALSQTQNGFNEFNPYISNGQFVVMPFRLLTNSWISIFKPTTWGYLANEGVGLSWAWWFLYFANFLGIYLLLALLFSEIAQIHRILIGLIYVYSPFMQYWSFWHSEIFAGGLWTLNFMLLGFISNSKIKKFAFFLLMFWSAVCTVLGNIYPPRIIAIVYFCIFIGVGFFLEYFFNRPSTKSSFSKSKNYLDFFSFFLILIFFTTSVGLVFYVLKIKFSDVVNLIQHTRYPGDRFFSGGTFPLEGIFNNWYLTPSISFVQKIFGNSCEESAFFYMFPITIPLFFYQCWREKKIISYIGLSSILLICFLTIYNLFGFTQSFTYWSGLFMIYPQRTQIAIGLADLVLLGFVCFYFQKFNLSKKIEKILILFWLLISGFCLYRLGYSQKWYVNLVFIILLSWQIYCIHKLLIKKQVNSFLKLILGLSFLSTCWWNPIVLDGTTYLLKNSLSQKILELDSINYRKTNWIVLGNRHLANLPRMLGIKSLGGYTIYPDTQLWEVLDPKKEKTFETNQAAFISFDLSTNSRLSIESSGNGSIEIKLPNHYDLLRQLKITHVIVKGFDKIAIFEREFSTAACGLPPSKIQINKNLVIFDLTQPCKFPF